ncbi:MAG TPA: ABC transporter permease subunit [Candidatus Avichristensenella intestinipullorum]|jgi:putative spermidine/putrescine transport system permease protein|uniref:ABC transporter permease subunit n=1 Tax=Candidatus Avichristensenella intestinipullorum TaxID=2840693 RepID=A0A9D0YXC9_9FIRM|nr:ABC transporter permease subunit [Candidatus Avichristensenella intestinipullorum]
MLMFLAFVVAFMGMPLLSLISTSLSSPETGGFSLENFVSIFTSKFYFQSFRNSFVLSLQSSLYGILIALFCSYAITRFASEHTQNNLLVVVNMTSNFAGLPLGFALTVMLGSSGMFVTLLKAFGIDITQSFSIRTVQGLVIAYTYFQVPLGIMLLYPIYRGIRDDWKEAASILGASSVQFWTRIGIPAILPSILSTFTVLFANAMGAFATAYYLVSSSYNIVPIRIGALMSGDIRTKPELGSALAITLAMVLIVVMLINDWASRVAGRRGLKS